METGQPLSVRQNKGWITRTTVIPVAGAARGGARDRVAASETQLAGFVLDRERTNDGRCLCLFVRGAVASGFASFATCAEFVEAEGTGTEMGALVKAALVADNFSRIEGRATPGGRLGGVAVEAAAAKVLGLLAGGIICKLYGDGGTCRRRQERGVVVCLEGVSGKAELGGDDEGSVLELDCLGVRAVGNWVRIYGVLLKVV